MCSTIPCSWICGYSICVSHTKFATPYTCSVLHQLLNLVTAITVGKSMCTVCSSLGVQWEVLFERCYTHSGPCIQPKFHAWSCAETQADIVQVHWLEVIDCWYTIPILYVYKHCINCYTVDKIFPHIQQFDIVITIIFHVQKLCMTSRMT